MKKRMYLIVFLFLTILCFGNSGVAEAEETTSIAIAQDNFPDANVRKALSENFDKNKDMVLSEEEIVAAKKLSLDLSKESFEIDIRGISKLRYVKDVYIEVQRIKNIEELEAMPQLISLGLWTSNRSIDISKNINLRELFLKMPLDKMVDINENRKLKKLTLWGAHDMKKITILNSPELRHLYLNFYNCEDVTIKNCSKLLKVIIDSIKVKKLKLKKLPKLEVLEIEGAKKLKKLTLPSLPKLKQFEIDKNYLKKFNFKKMPNLKILTVTGARKIKKIDLRPLKKLRELTWKNGKLQKIQFGKKKKLDRMYLQHNQLGGTWKLSRFPELSRFYCSYNRIKCIDGRNNKYLWELVCKNNKLRKLDIYNTEPSVVKATGNPKVEVYLPYKYGYTTYYLDKTAKVHYREKY